jgi:hypothetical protein
LTLASIRYYLSERFRLRFEDSGLEDLMDEDGELNAETAQAISNAVGAINETGDSEAPQSESMKSETIQVDPVSNPLMNGEIKTLDGEIAGDESAADAINYQVLLGKIDSMLERLKLDA